MKSKLLFTLLLGLISLAEATEAPVQEAYRYYAFGTGPILLIPNVTVGHRDRCGKYGFDKSISFSTVGYIHQLQVAVVRHVYLDPTINSRYFGIGVAASGAITNKGCGGAYFAPDFVYGKRFGDERRQFLEFHLQIPNIYVDSGVGVTPIPGMYVRYGTAF